MSYGKHPFLSTLIILFCVEKDDVLCNKDQAEIYHMLPNVEFMILDYFQFVGQGNAVKTVVNVVKFRSNQEEIKSNMDTKGERIGSSMETEGDRTGYNVDTKTNGTKKCLHSVDMKE